MDYDLQGWGDKKQLFLEAAEEIIQNGLKHPLLDLTWVWRLGRVLSFARQI